ncbi:hypothetical protein ABZ942_27710 [Nocardia sp. NPDC046473]|uniref:hypothetical protein n=1 Tax=Nocardia sp. NPDC046473 TaxID=3155733 RepID=UPI0033FF970F
MTRQRPSPENASTGRQTWTPAGRIGNDANGTRIGVRSTASSTAVVLCAVAAGPVAGGQLVLLGKPFGGAVGLPGAVVGYIVLTAVALGLLTAALSLWRWRPSRGIASASGVLVGVAVVVAGAVDAVVVFTVAVLVAGATMGPLLAMARALAADLGPGGFAVLPATAGGGLAAAAWLGSHYYEEPGSGLIIAGGLTAVLGAGAGLLSISRRGPLFPVRPAKIDIQPRSILSGYVAIGLAVGGTVLPALHLLLFRWNEFGSEQLGWLLFAAAPTIFVVALPGHRPAAVPILLILAAGGPLLIATAPGPVTLTIGLAVALMAAARAMTALDETMWATSTPADRGAAATVSTMVAAIAGLAGLGLVDLLDRLMDTGSALTVLAACVLIAALLFSRRQSRGRPNALGSASEGSAQ